MMFMMMMMMRVFLSDQLLLLAPGYWTRSEYVSAILHFFPLILLIRVRPSSDVLMKMDVCSFARVKDAYAHSPFGI